jgi:hypothetical protein
MVATVKMITATTSVTQWWQYNSNSSGDRTTEEFQKATEGKKKENKKAGEGEAVETTRTELKTKNCGPSLLEEFQSTSKS